MRPPARSRPTVVRPDPVRPPRVPQKPFCRGIASDPTPALRPSRAPRSKSRLTPLPPVKTLLPPIKLLTSGVARRAPASVLLPNGFWNRLLLLRKPSGELLGRARFAVPLASVAAAAPARPIPKACTSADLFIAFIFPTFFNARKNPCSNVFKLCSDV